MSEGTRLGAIDKVGERVAGLIVDGRTEGRKDGTREGTMVTGARLGFTVGSDVG